VSFKAAILVTGGSGGVGGSVCRRLAEEGYLPVVGYRSQAEEAQKIAEETGGLAQRLDLTDEASISVVVSDLGALDIPLVGVVLCASPPPTIGPFTKIDNDDMTRQWQVNVAGPQRLLAALINGFFRPRKVGAVVAVLTAAMGDEARPAGGNMGAYVTAKYGLLGVLKAASAEFKWLRCVEIRPGFIETDMLNAFDTRYLEIERNRLPDGRFSTPDEVAAEIVDRLLEGTS